MPHMLGMAIQAAITQKGVAVLVISGDIALSQARFISPAVWPQAPKAKVIPSSQELQEMANILQKGKVTLFCGHGCAGAHQELMQLCDTLKAPMVHALRGKEYVEYDNPYDVGMTGFIGFASGYYAIEDCDTLLLMGTNFPYRQFYPSKAKVIQVDINGAAIGRRCPVDLGIIGDVKDTINALLPLLKKRSDSSFLNKAVKHYQQSRKDLNDLAQKNESFIHPQYLVKSVSDASDDDAVFLCDVGTPTVWAARYLKMNGKRRLLGSFNHGSMANALSQSIGVQATFPERQTIALCGDGGLAMLLGELLTLIQVHLPVKIIVLNNGILSFVDLEMKTSGFLSFGTDLKNPNFADMANTMGIFAKRVENSEQLEDALKSVLSHSGPALLDVLTNPTELILPPKIQLEQAKGFSLYVLKAIMSGRGTEVVDLAEGNLWR
jgi:thiamine pyrophosphate-dependent acetolactate synthase large subunit-like protein